MRLSGLLLAALAARLAAAEREELAVDEAEELALDVATANESSQAEYNCYCKEVDSVSECPDNKYAGKPARADGPRFFHAGADGKKSLCCKLEEYAWYNFAGWAYTKQPTLDKCGEELRPLPETKCCLLADERGVAGVRVRAARSLSAKSRPHGVPEFRKTPPFVRLEDIASAEDHDGTEVPRDSLQAFLEKRFAGKLECSKTPTMASLFAQEQEGCRLREAPTSDCCCVEASVTEVDRCFPVRGAATEEQAAPQDLDSEVKTREEHGFKQDKVVDARGPRRKYLEALMPKLLEGLVDPLQQDLPDTPMNEADMVFNWTQAPEQWTRNCTRMGDIQAVKSTRTTERVRAGQNCRMQRMGKVMSRRCTPKYKTVTKTIYSQTTEQKCLQWRWTRTCPAGQGLYQKRIDPGTCMGEDSGLRQVAPISFECPAGYQSKFANKLCTCPTDCS